MSRVRNFCGVCYDEQIKDIVKYLKDYTDRGNIRFWALIQHDAETDEKSKHYHFVVEFYNAKTLTAVNKNIGVRDGLIQVCTDVRGYCCYMLHKYEIDKKNYFIKQVESNDIERFIMFVNAKNDNQCNNDKLVWKKFSDLVLNNDLPLYSVLDTLCKDKDIEIKTVRRNAYLFKVFYDSAFGECLSPVQKVSKGV